MDTTVLFVPGRPAPVAVFRPLLRLIEERGYRTVGIEVDWRNDNVPHWLAQIKQICEQHNPAKTVLVGFSVGAFLAILTAAADWSPQRLLALSPSPRFREDLTPEIRSRQSRQLLEFFESISFQDVARKITAPTALVVGRHETRQMVHRARRLHAALPGSSLRLVQGLHRRCIADPHNPCHPNYIKAALRALS